MEFKRLPMLLLTQRKSHDQPTLGPRHWRSIRHKFDDEQATDLALTAIATSVVNQQMPEREYMTEEEKHMVSTALKALLSVLAVAGYQNREKIGELLKGLTQNRQDQGPTGQQEAGGGLGDLLGGLTGGSGGLGGLLGGSSTGGVLRGGLGDLLKQFEHNGHGETAKSWVQTGPNSEIDDRQLSEALGPEVLEDLSARTGLSPEEILSRLSRDLPKAVDDLTPNGVLPQEDDPFEGQITPPPKTQII